MSSLRISHQNRAIGATTAGGDTGRSEHADDGASFAVALGAAAGGVPKDGAVLLGGKSGDSSDGSAAPRKRADNPGKPADAASVAASIAGSLVAAPAVAGAAVPADAGGETGTAGGALSAGVATGAPLTAVGPLNVATQTVAGKKAIVAADAAAPGAAPIATGASAVTPRGSSAATTLTTAAPVPAPASTSAPRLADTAADDPVPPGQSQPMPVNPASPAPAGAPVSQLVAPAFTPASTNHLAGTAASGTPDPATIGATADASGVASALPLAMPNAPSPGGMHAAAGIATGAPPALLPVTAGQAATADGGAFGFAPRDRLASVAAPQDPVNISAAAAAAGAGTAPAPTSAAAPTPGLASDPAGAGTIADQVAGQLARMVSNGSREMVMKLHPPELGDLTVRIAVSGRDVSAWFASPQPQVQSAISAAIGQLQTSLGNAGYNLNGAWVGGDASGGRQQQAALPRALPAIGAPSATSAVLPAGAVSRSASSGLNIYV